MADSLGGKAINKMSIGASRLGETFHRDNPSPLTEQLYLSAARAISGRVLLDLGITCIINATLELPTMAYHTQDALQIAVEDRVASKLYVYFDLVADKINSVHNANGKVMIYCRAGMSRSASLCIAYFIKYHGMSVEEAFQYVRARRPIIHPNVGFLRQLRDFERKLRSKHHLSDGGGPSAAKRKRELPELTFAVECCSSKEEDDLMVDYDTGIKIIKPRPKPRLPKIRFNEAMEPCAQSYQNVLVQICEDDPSLGAENIDPKAAAAGMAIPQVGAPARQKAALLSGEEPKTVALTRRPVVFENLTVAGNSASSSCSSPDQQQQQSLTADGAAGAAAAAARTPFTKISEPGKIAVSFIQQPLLFLALATTATSSSSSATTGDSNAVSDSSSSRPHALLLPLPPFQPLHHHHHLTPTSNSLIRSSNNASFFASSSLLVFTELHPLPQISQEVHLECVVDFPQALTSSSSTSSNATSSSAPAASKRTTTTAMMMMKQSKTDMMKTTALINQIHKADILLTKLYDGPAHCGQVQTLNCPGVFKRQKILEPPDPSLPQRQGSKTSYPIGPPAIPTAGGAAKKLSRTGSSRISIKLPGLKISPAPKQWQKDPTDADAAYLATASILLPPTFLETLENELKTFVKPFLMKFRTAKTTISPLLTTAVIGHASLEAFEIPIKDKKTSFRIAWMLAVPRRTVIAATETQVAKAQVCEALGELPLDKIMPPKEFPYYFPCRSESKALQMFRAKEEPQIESCWFFALAPRKSTKTVCLKSDRERVRARPIEAEDELPEIKWAVSRFEVDVNVKMCSCRPMEDVIVVKGLKSSIGGLRARHVADIQNDEDYFPLHAPNLIPRANLCQYSPRSISTMNVFPIYGIASVLEACTPQLELNNMYSEPCTIPSYGRVASDVGEEQFVPVVYEPDVQDRTPETIVDIPDVVGDINALKTHLMLQNDPMIISIWLEVFKRSVIRSRPIFPFVTLSEFLSVADQSEEKESIFWESAEGSDTAAIFSKMPSDIVFDTVSDFALTSEEIVLAEDCDDFYLDCLEEAECQLTGQFAHTFHLTLTVSVITIPLEDSYLWFRPQQNVNFLPTYAISKLSAPLHYVGVSLEIHAPGMVGVGTKTIPFDWLQRKPFKILTNMRSVPDQALPNVELIATGEVPQYEFVQDIEDQADSAVHRLLPTEGELRAVEESVDTFWFFDLTTEDDKESATAASVAEDIRPATPAAQFKLFLPDPDMADRLGTVSMDVFKKEDEEEPTKTGSREVLLPALRPAPSVQDLLQRQSSIKSMTKPKTEKRVSFMDSSLDQYGSNSRVKSSNTSSAGKQDPSTARNSVGNLVSYQRPRTRSWSQKRNSRSAEQDKKTLEHLTASMKQADEILERRRRDPQRGRIAARQPKSDALYTPSMRRGISEHPTPSSSSYRLSSESAEQAGGANSSSTSLRGLLDIAQNWILQRGPSHSATASSATTASPSSSSSISQTSVATTTRERSRSRLRRSQR